MRQKRRAAAGKYGVNRICCLTAYTLSFGGDSREIPGSRKENKRTRYAAGRGRPALPTASPRMGHDVISSVSREIPGSRKENKRTRYAGARESRPIDGYAANRARCHFERSREIPCNRNENNRTRTPKNTCPRGLRAEKSPTLETETIGHEHQKTLARAGSAPRNPLH